MSGENTCSGCGYEAEAPQGLAAHQRSCEEYQAAEVSEEEASSEPLSTPTSVSTAVAERVYERDDETCVRCGDNASVIHRYDDKIDNRPQNLVTLCQECDEFISGGDPFTKRSQVDR